MKKDRLLTILVAVILGFVLVEGVLAAASQAGDEVVSAYLPVHLPDQSRELSLPKPAIDDDIGQHTDLQPTNSSQKEVREHEIQSASLTGNPETNRAFPNTKNTDAPTTNSPGPPLREPETLR